MSPAFRDAVSQRLAVRERRGHFLADFFRGSSARLNFAAAAQLLVAREVSPQAVEVPVPELAIAIIALPALDFYREAALLFDHFVRCRRMFVPRGVRLRHIERRGSSLLAAAPCPID